MTPLSRIVPIDDVKSIVPDFQLTERTKNELQRFAAEDSETLREIALSSWDYALSTEFNDINPRLLGDAVDRNDPKLLIKMERALGVKLLDDLYSFKMRVSAEDAEPFAEGTFASVYRRRLHIADLKLLNPNKPRSDAEYPDQTHESLRLLSVLLERARVVAREIGAERITGTAANRRLFDAFQKHGFLLSDTRGSRPALQAGAGIPVTLSI